MPELAVVETSAAFCHRIQCVYLSSAFLFFYFCPVPQFI